MCHSYKIKYASYLESLIPEQRNIELGYSGGKNLKRTADKKEDKEVNIMQFILVEFSSSFLNSILCFVS
jgi:hypothetical protein